jgi:hypothetical protein
MDHFDGETALMSLDEHSAPKKVDATQYHSRTQHDQFARTEGCLKIMPMLLLADLLLV